MKAAAVFLAALSTHVLGEDIEETSGGMAVKFSGKSGKFTLYSKAVGPGDKNALTFEIDRFQEFTENGEEVAKSHQFKDFKKTEFTFSSEKDVVVGNATAAKVSFKSSMNDLGEFWVDTFLFEKEGVVSPVKDDKESPQWGVGPGDVKFNMGIKQWKWCTSEDCDGKVGHHIKVDMEIKTKHTPKEGKGKGGGTGRKESKALDLGGGIPLDFTPELMVDGVPSLMPDEYPMFGKKGSKQIITFYFPKFEDNVIYDPLVSGSDSESLIVDDSGCSRPLMGIAGLIVLLAGALH